MTADPHGGIAPLFAGVPLDMAAWAMVLVHGRGGSPEGMLPIARAAGATDAALIAPRAAGGSWYPGRFLAPIAENEPWLSSAIASVTASVRIAIESGITRERVVLVGFSQGACLSLEFVARAAADASLRFGGVAAFAGALVGADDEQRRTLRGSLDGTPVFLSVGDDDEHIPEARVRETNDIFSALGALAEMRVYPGVGHTIVGDQIQALRRMIVAVEDAVQSGTPMGSPPVV